MNNYDPFQTLCNKVLILLNKPAEKTTSLPKIRGRTLLKIFLVPPTLIVLVSMSFILIDLVAHITS